MLLSSSIAPAHHKLQVDEQDEFMIFYRRLEQGAFEVPVFDLDAKSQALTSDELHFILQGISLQTVRYRKRYQQKLVSS